MSQELVDKNCDSNEPSTSQVNIQSQVLTSVHSSIIVDPTFPIEGQLENGQPFLMQIIDGNDTSTAFGNLGQSTSFNDKFDKLLASSSDSSDS